MSYFLGIPIGYIVHATPGSPMPKGWLICDGHSEERSDYPELAAKLASDYPDAKPWPNDKIFYVPNFAREGEYWIKARDRDEWSR